MHKPIQIVDEYGKYQTTVDSPKFANLNNQIRLISRVMITNKDGQYLLQKRADDMFVYPGFWDSSAAGHVDEGETEQDAAYRELAVEVGISDVKLTKAYEIYNETEENHGYLSKTYSHVYFGEFDSAMKTLKIDPAEVSEVKWFSVNELKYLASQPNTVTEGLSKIINELK